LIVSPSTQLHNNQEPSISRVQTKHPDSEMWGQELNSNRAWICVLGEIKALYISHLK